jgi:hypothetical protein
VEIERKTGVGGDESAAEVMLAAWEMRRRHWVDCLVDWWNSALPSTAGQSYRRKR